MKVVAFNGSPRKDGNTTILINRLFSELQKEGIETELVQLAGKNIRGCIACSKCFQNKDQRCAVKDDIANECIEKMLGAEGIVLGSPTYFMDVTAEMKALIDRAGFVSIANGRMLKNKVGATLSAVRRSGAIHTLDTMNHFIYGGRMVHAGQCLAVGKDKGDVERDDEGMEIVKALGQRMAWVLKKLYG
jgi:multimeric flavodoxin WrbA